jgi:hypothetical protein
MALIMHDIVKAAKKFHCTICNNGTMMTRETMITRAFMECCISQLRRL